ncbi:MAG: hypothetical protein K2M48_01430 [Clostridiales bacterium]|nr:hypothetical protein [Clostridiales bacterium]
MKEWLKFFGLSFFSDKIAKGAKERGVFNCVLGFVLTLVFIFCGVLAANTVPFYTHYGNATQFKSFVHNAVSNLQISVDGGVISADQQVNTVLSDVDAELYGKDGYSIIVDTRSSKALDDFEAYCLSKKDEKEISYEEYLELSDEEKGDYDFKVRYTPNELVLTAEHVSKYEEYLSASTDSDVIKEYSKLAESKGGIPAEDYMLKLYTLYIKTYYPDMSAFERVGDVPLLRSYYYRNYLNSNDITKSLFVFSDVLFGFFDTDGGLSITFYGDYSSASDGLLAPGNVDDFIKSVFGSSVSTSANVYLMNTCKYIPLIALIPFVLALLMKLVFVLIKNDEYKKISVCFKTECSYLAVSSLLTAIVMFICGFFISSNTLNVLPLIIYGSILTVRTAIYLIIETYKHKSAAKKVKADSDSQE